MNQYDPAHHHHNDASSPWASWPPMRGFRHGRVGPPMHGHGGWGGGPRARKGDIRAAALLLLAENPMHGYQIIQELTARSGGAWSPSPGSVYPTLQLLEDEGLVVSEEADGKRVYKLTEAGTEASKAAAAAGAPWDEFAQGGAVSGRWQLREAMGKLAVAVMQVGASASDEQVDRTLQILSEARKNIFAILAED